ncbi:MAG: adenosylcobinamide-phosphate synthase CbiB [Candidatus Pacebacteria bacterium]|nr:adenosylcobinamide-phosphate synthase CbiB [Candidatus Paceibacterota bacterium]
MNFIYQNILPLSATVLAFRLLVLLAAAVADAAFGTRRLWQSLPHPVVGIGWIIDRCDRGLNRDNHARWFRFCCGLVTVLIVLAVTMGLGLALTGIGSASGWGWLIEGTVVAVFLAGRNLLEHIWAVYLPLSQPNPELIEARRELSMVVGRDTDRLDGSDISRSAIESLAENYSDGVLAPAFWYLVGGLIGIIGYKAINSLDSMIGHHSPRYEYFGKAAARLDDLVNWLPARLSGLTLVLAAAVMPRASLVKAWRCLWRDGRNHRSPNAGYPEAAVAGALSLALSGPRWYQGERHEEPWIGRSDGMKGRIDLQADDLRAAMVLVTLAWVTGLVLVAVVAVLVL